MGRGMEGAGRGNRERRRKMGHGEKGGEERKRDEKNKKEK